MGSTASGAKCYLPNQVVLDKVTPLVQPLNAKSLTLELVCETQAPAVLSTRRVGTNSILIQSVNAPSLSRLNSNLYAVLVPTGTTKIIVSVDAQRDKPFTLRLDSVEAFQAKNNIHAITLFLFVGFCVGLAMYVGFLGRGLKRSGFLVYSIYISSIALFFSFQEGLLNYLLPMSDWHNQFRWQYLLAGIVVMSSVTFLARLLDFRILINRSIYNSLINASRLVLACGIAMFVYQPLASMGVGMLQGWMTLLIVFSVFIVTGYAAIQRVPTANLVLVALGLVFFAMLFRIWLVDFSPFLNRYALIFSTSFEAFLLAIAASEKVRYLELERSNAYLTAAQDSLCEVLNRKGWILAAQRKVQFSQNNENAFIVIYVDINRFKRINTDYGHHIGDKALQTIAKIIRHQSREDDVVGRAGSDEFVIFSTAANAAQAERIYQRYNFKLNHLDLWINGKQLSVSATVSSITASGESVDVEQMLDAADRRVNERKAEAPVTTS